MASQSPQMTPLIERQCVLGDGGRIPSTESNYTAHACIQSYNVSNGRKASSLNSYKLYPQLIFILAGDFNKLPADYVSTNPELLSIISQPSRGSKTMEQTFSIVLYTCFTQVPVDSSNGAQGGIK